MKDKYPDFPASNIVMGNIRSVRTTTFFEILNKFCSEESYNENIKELKYCQSKTMTKGSIELWAYDNTKRLDYSSL